MPPKKTQQQNINPYIPIFVLPLFIKNTIQQTQAQKILKYKPINIKKSFNRTKIIQIFKQKGLSQYINSEQNLTSQGKQYLSTNIKTLIQQFIDEVNKPVDPKKDAGKKDTKKDSKNQQPTTQQTKQPTIQLNISKKCNDFYFYLDYPQTLQQFKTFLQNGLKIDIVIIIQQKNKAGSKIPDYNLLNKNLQNNDFIENLNTTKLNLESKRIKNHQILQRNNKCKEIVKYIKKLQNTNPEFSSVIVKQIPYQKDLSHPQNNQWNFINTIFNNLGQITIQKQNYQKWIKTQVKKVPLIQPLKQIIKKQVPIQSQDKKGKKDANKQPQFQTIQQIIQTKYESIKQNIKSNLQTYKKIQNLKTSKLLSQNKKSSSTNQIKNCLLTCIQSIQLQLNKKSINQTKMIEVSQIQNKINTQPLVKLNNVQTLSNNLRQIQKYCKQEFYYDLVSKQKQIQENVTLEQIIHQNPQKKDVLQLQYLIKTITNFMKLQQSKFKWNFNNRTYRQKLNKKQILSQIQKQILKDPKIYKGILKNDNIQLLCLSILNPPGRILYNNYIFQQKVIPNFQNWFNNNKLKQRKQQSNINNTFYDYKFQDNGNLSIKTQRLTPNDNVIIYDQKISFGNQSFKINHFQKDNTIYGIRKKNQNNNQFWIRNQNNNINISIFQQQHEVKMTSHISQIQKSSGQDHLISQQTLENVIKQKRVQVWCRTDIYIISNNPYPQIIWQYSTKQTRFDQIKRQFGPKGQITSYLRDGSVKIYYLNGNTSSYRNNKWQRIINNQIVNQNGQKIKLIIKQFTQGDKIIKIRQDQTTFVQYSNGNILTIFSDQTKILYKKKNNTYQIKTYNTKLKQQIIVRIILPKSQNKNIIGHGSAFAYLGLNNLQQRSYDGYIYEMWTNKFSSHLYNEKYEYENEIYEQQIRLLYLKDGTFIKIIGNGQITYIQDNQQNIQQKLKYKWNQLFTIQDLHQIGIYDINLNQGWIKTKDDQSNIFKIHIQDKNQINIAVSFKIDDQGQIKNDYGNGFHIPEQNYFLPSPNNSITPRLFSFQKQTQTYYQYLTQDQINNMQNPKQNYYIQQINLQNKIIKLYSKKLYKQQYFNNQNKKQITFSIPPSSQQFNYPSSLLSKQTKINMNIENHNIEYRILQKIQWDQQFNNISKIQKVIVQKKQKRLKQINVIN